MFEANKYYMLRPESRVVPSEDYQEACEYSHFFHSINSEKASAEGVPFPDNLVPETNLSSVLRFAPQFKGQDVSGVKTLGDLLNVVYKVERLSETGAPQIQVINEAGEQYYVNIVDGSFFENFVEVTLQ